MKKKVQRSRAKARTGSKRVTLTQIGTINGYRIFRKNKPRNRKR